MNKKVVVFGGCGFIGVYLVEELLRRGYEVIAADINYSQYIEKKYFKKCDILDINQVNDIVKKSDFVFNLAGNANLDDAVNDPIKTMQLNVMGNLNILESCRKNKIKRFIYASSAYAMSDKGSFYGISKLTSEKLVEEYYKKFGLEFTILRYGSVYGEKNFYNNYIYNLIKKALETGKIIHNGDGEEVREYIHAADIAKLSAQVIEDEKFANEHLILTGIERIHRKELFDMINEILGDKLEIILNKNGYKNHYKTTPYSFHPTRSKKLVANPYIDLGQGILECIKNIEENGEI